MPKIARDSERPGAPGENVAVGSDEEIRARLIQFANAMFGSWSEMERAADIPHTTAVAWRRRGAPLPGMESLLKLARLGLSLDWLVTGRGQMQARLGAAARGAFLEDLRPSLQREAGVGDATGTQAFAQLVKKLGVEGMLERASSGLLADYRHEVRLLDQFHRHAELVNWVALQLEEIATRVMSGSDGHHGDDVDLLRKRLHDYLPEDMRPGSPTYEQFWEAVRLHRRAFVEEVQARLAAGSASSLPTGSSASEPNQRHDAAPAQEAERRGVRVRRKRER